MVFYAKTNYDYAPIPKYRKSEIGRRETPPFKKLMKLRQKLIRQHKPFYEEFEFDGKIVIWRFKSIEEMSI